MNALAEHPASTIAPAKPSMYRLRYLRNGYTIADALRPQPDWGAKRYTVEAEPLGDRRRVRCTSILFSLGQSRCRHDLPPRLLRRAPLQPGSPGAGAELLRSTCLSYLVTT